MSWNDTAPFEPVVPVAVQLSPRVVLVNFTLTDAPGTAPPLELRIDTVVVRLLEVEAYVTEPTWTLTVVGGGGGGGGGLPAPNVTLNAEPVPEGVSPLGVAVADPSIIVIGSFGHVLIGPVTPLIVAQEFVNETVPKSLSGKTPCDDDGASCTHSAELRATPRIWRVVENVQPWVVSVSCNTNVEYRNIDVPVYVTEAVIESPAWTVWPMPNDGPGYISHQAEYEGTPLWQSCSVPSCSTVPLE